MSEFDQRPASSITKGSFIKASAWEGTLVTSRRPRVVEGEGKSNASKNCAPSIRVTFM